MRKIIILILTLTLLQVQIAYSITPIRPLEIDPSAKKQTEILQTNLDKFYKEINLRRRGEGIKIAIIDTGIGVYPEYSKFKTNSCFTDKNYKKTKQKGDKRFTNNKVIVSRVFNSDPNYQDEKESRAISPHGSHVAGIIACNTSTDAYLQGGYAGKIEGIAPYAQLGSYVVFPGENMIPTSEDIAKAIVSATDDKMDIINMSIGNTREDENDEIIHQAVIYAINKGVVVVAASGNDGPWKNTIFAPAQFKEVITVGSVTGGRKLIIEAKTENLTLKGEVGTLGVPKKSVKGRVIFGGVDNRETFACKKEDISDEVSNKIAIIERGECFFADKIKNLASKNALGAIIVSYDENPSPSISSPYQENVDLPTLIVKKSEGDKLKEIVKEKDIELTFNLPKLKRSESINTLSSFSSRGDNSINKPDILAPGENIISSISSSSEFDNCSQEGTCFALMSGTSMSAPYITGIIALLKQKYKFNNKELKSLILHTGSSKNVSNRENEGYGLVNPIEILKQNFIIKEDYLKGTTLTIKNIRNKSISVEFIGDNIISENIKLKPYEERKILVKIKNGDMESSIIIKEKNNEQRIFQVKK